MKRWNFILKVISPNKNLRLNNNLPEPPRNGDRDAAIGAIGNNKIKRLYNRSNACKIDTNCMNNTEAVKRSIFWIYWSRQKMEHNVLVEVKVKNRLGKKGGTEPQYDFVLM